MPGLRKTVQPKADLPQAFKAQEEEHIHASLQKGVP